MAVRLSVDPNQDLDQLLDELKSYAAQDVVLVLPPEPRALQTLDNFYALRKEVREAEINLSFTGGNKTIRGLAKLLGFTIEKETHSEGVKSDPGLSTPPAAPVESPAPIYVPQSFEVNAPPPAAPADDPLPDPVFVPLPPNARPVTGIYQAPARPAPAVVQVESPAIVPAESFSGPPPAAEAEEPPSVRPMPRPAPAINFGRAAGEGSSYTKIYDDERGSGLFGSGPAPAADYSADFRNHPPVEEVSPGPLAGDNAAARFRTFSEPDDGEDGPPVKSRRVKKGLFARQEKPPAPGRADRAAAGFAPPSILASNSQRGLLVRVRRLLGMETPGTRIPKPPISPSLRRSRRQQRGSAGLMALAALVMLLIAGLLLFLLLRPGGEGGVFTPAPPVALVIPVRSEERTDKVRLYLVPGGSTSGVSGVTSLPTATSAAPLAASPVATATTTIAAQAEPARLPVEEVKSGEIKKSGEQPASGSRQVPAETARGTATLFNSANTAKSFGAGTIVYSAPNGVIYRMVEGVTVRAGNVFGGQPGTATVRVAPDKAGPIGNLATPVDRFLADAVGVRVGPVTGGTERPEKFVQQQDIDALKKSLQEQARAESNNLIKYDPASQAPLVLKSTEPVCTFSPQKAGEVADAVKGSCSMTLEAIIYSKETYTRVLQTNFVKDPGYKLVDNTPVETVGEARYDTENGQRYIEVQAKGRVMPVLDTAKLREAIAGKPKADAPAIIAQGFPQVDLSLLNLNPVTDKLIPEAKRLELRVLPDVVVQATPVIAPAGTVSGTGGPVTGVAGTTQVITAGTPTPAPTPKS